MLTRVTRVTVPSSNTAGPAVRHTPTVAVAVTSAVASQFRRAAVIRARYYIIHCNYDIVVSRSADDDSASSAVFVCRGCRPSPTVLLLLLSYLFLYDHRRTH